MNKKVEATMRRMDEQQELLLAKLLTEEAHQLAERAQTKGVTAYLERPVHRLRPNERFLQNTLGNIRSGMPQRSPDAHEACSENPHSWQLVDPHMKVADLRCGMIHGMCNGMMIRLTANRRADEDEMWERRELQRQRAVRERGGRRPAGESPPLQRSARARDRSSSHSPSRKRSRRQERTLSEGQPRSYTRGVDSPMHGRASRQPVRRSNSSLSRQPPASGDHAAVSSPSSASNVAPSDSDDSRGPHYLSDADRSAERRRDWQSKLHRQQCLDDCREVADDGSTGGDSDGYAEGTQRQRHGKCWDKQRGGNRTSGRPRQQQALVQHEGLRDDEIQQWLSRKRVRGRGGVGAQADECGPWLEADAWERQLAVNGTAVKGPQRPSWLVADTECDNGALPRIWLQAAAGSAKHERGLKRGADTHARVPASDTDDPALTAKRNKEKRDKKKKKSKERTKKGKKKKRMSPSRSPAPKSVGDSSRQQQSPASSLASSE